MPSSRLTTPTLSQHKLTPPALTAKAINTGSAGTTLPSSSLPTLPQNKGLLNWVDRSMSKPHPSFSPSGRSSPLPRPLLFRLVARYAIARDRVFAARSCVCKRTKTPTGEKEW